MPAPCAMQAATRKRPDRRGGVFDASENPAFAQADEPARSAQTDLRQTVEAVAEEAAIGIEARLALRRECRRRL